MKLRNLMLAGGALAALVGAPAQASILDTPQFRVLGLVVVWGADSETGTTPVVSDFIINSDLLGNNDADLTAGDVHAVVTGTLSPVRDGALDAVGIGEFSGPGGAFVASQSSTGILDASDTFSAFTLNANTDVYSGGLRQESSFYVASNTAFAIDAVAAVSGTATNFSLADIAFEMAVTDSGNDGLAFGANAQFPHSGGATGGMVTAVNDLGDMGSSTQVFAGNRRTAASRGSIAEQSVRFDAVYTLGGLEGYDLSLGAGEIEADVTYTVYVP